MSIPESQFGTTCGAVLKEFLELYKGLFKNSIYEGLCLRFHEIVSLSPLGQLATSLISLVSRRVMGVRTCESRCLFSGSKGEVCCIEPLHAKVELRDHPITQYSLLAMASLTKVTCCLQKALCELYEKSPRNKILLYLLYMQMLYFVFMFFLKILVIGLKPSLKVWMTFPYGRVSNEAKCFLNYGHKLFLE